MNTIQVTEPYAKELSNLEGAVSVGRGNGVAQLVTKYEKKVGKLRMTRCACDGSPWWHIQ